MRLAVVCSAHGFGHLTRQLALAGPLQDAGASLTFFTAAPPSVLSGSPGVEVVPWAVDAGIVQHDSLTEDVEATRVRLAERHAEARLDALADRLRGFDGVIVDIAPAGLEAARRAGRPAVAVGNFSWPWIYDRYPLLRAEAERLRAWQRPHPSVALHPGPGLPEDEFSSVVPGGLVGRRAERPWPLPPGAVLVSFGGFGLEALDRALPRIEGVTWVMSTPMMSLDRPDCLYVEGVAYPALVAGAQAVLTKPGYGIFAEAALAGTRLLWVERGGFPEAPFLAHAMRARGDISLGSRPGEPGFAEELRAALQSIRGQTRPLPAADDTRWVADLLLREVQRQS